ncbi:LGFP repeat-containing protein [Corynebacterium mendelii]|uniref:YtxH domain-containing protein n=1 Tax=Corynebacterium mendelii TaxID=2765362 RepID=A0A939IXT1_9CORY|nr:hypothetical protein [Corynebacterium mendelii]MBN9644795.1 hypothetical protein [Corynebacterium mendelii]
MTVTTRTRLIAATCALGLAAAGVTACSKADEAADSTAASLSQAADAAASEADKAAAEADKAVDKIDKSLKEGGDKAADAAKDAKDAAEDAAKDAKDAAKDAADKATEAAKDAKDAATDTAKDAKDAADDAAKDAKDAADDAAKDAKDAADAAGTKAADAVAEAEGETMVTVTDAAGTEIKVPDAIKVAYDKLGGQSGPTGALTNVTEKDGKWVASYANGWHIAFTEKTGAYPVKGRIGQEWFENGAIDNPIGMPTAPEHPKADGGWVQEFTQGQVWAAENGDAGAIQDTK